MTKKRVYFILLCLTLCFIWGNSILSKEISGAISHFIADIIGGEQGSTDEGHHLVRKAAHFLEFASLGAAFLLWARETIENKGTRLALCAFFGVFVPLVDETIQIFSQRGPSLTDVWIDVSGYVTGALICFAVICLIGQAVRRKADEKHS